MKKIYLFIFILVSCLYQTASAACGPNQVQVIVTIIPDNDPQETSWNLYDDISDTLIASGTANSDTVCVLSSLCLKFTILDSYGDGICCGYGPGSYQVKRAGVVVASGGHFNYSEVTYFNCPQGHGCTNAFIAVKDTMTAPAPETWYSFTVDSTGIYNISTCDLGNTCDTKIYVYDHCAGIVPSEDNAGTTFYNDDGCSPGFQSFVSAAMHAGQTYYIRIGDYLSDCASQSINWQISFTGPIKGCMDTASCTYNPLATIPDTTCAYPPNVICSTAPDLAVDEQMLESSMYIDNLNVQQTNCYINEGCLAGYGMRRLIRFSTHIKNIGDEDYYIGAPDTVGGQFVYDPCHNHWHYAGYAEYLLFNALNQQVQQGFKNGFCVLDLECGNGGTAKYGCNNMGITAGCGDIYDASLDCQWIDITDIDTGNYTFVVRVNWDRSPDKLGHYEKTYDNNWAQLCLNLYYDNLGNKLYTILPDCRTYVDCAGDTFGNAQLDCMNNCNGSSVRGDLNVNLGRDTTDFLQYLTGMTAETLTSTTCNDLNADGRISVTDAARLNGCLRHNAGTITNFTNAQTAQHLCQFPYNVFNPLDTIRFGIGGVDWLHHYFDISILNPNTKVMGYELKIGGAKIDSVKNLAVGNYVPDIRFSSATGHITELSDEDQALFKQQAPLNFMRVYFSGLLDSTICITNVIDAVNENYEQIVGVPNHACVVNHIDTVVLDVAQVLNAADLQIIPNPSSGIFDLYVANHSLAGAFIRIYDPIGRVVYEDKDNSSLSNKMQFDLSNQQSGIYLLQISMNGMTATQRLVLVKQ